MRDMLPAVSPELDPPLTRLVRNVEGVVLGKRAVVETVVAALLARGHVLVEDVPGVGKTILARSLARSLDAPMKRIQCTPDLLPSDVTGASIYNPQDAGLRVPPRADLRSLRARRRDQPGHPPHPVGVPGGDGGAAGHGRR